MIKSLLLLLSLSLLVSCGEYQKLLRSEDAPKKYAAADSLYNAGKYKKALRLMEQIVPIYRGKPQAEALMFKYANTFYNLEDYFLSGYQFERFVSSYPKSDSVVLAAYRSAKSYYEISPRYSLDQKETYTALEKLQEFVNNYSNSSYRDEANAMVTTLKTKLEKKDLEIAKQYLRIYSYKPAIAAFDNFIQDHPGSIYRKDAFFHKFEAAYLLAIKSLPSLVEERLQTAKKYYKDFVKYFGESDLKPDADEILEDINERLATYNLEIN